MRLIIPSLMLAVVAATPGLAVAQDKVYRCGNEYTNRPAKGRDCKALDGMAGVTIIHGTRPQAQRDQAPVARASGDSPRVASAAPRARPASTAPTATVASAVPRPASNDPGQKARDKDARVILENELQRAQAKQVELVKDYNNGQPDKVGGESRNYQKYLDRVASMKAGMDRNQSDIDSIQRELSRVR